MLYLGADHNGFALKESVKKTLKKLRVRFVDLGNLVHDPKDDYPTYALEVAEHVKKKGGKGVLFCGSAEGVGIAANKVPGIRAAVVETPTEAQWARQDDDANIVCLSGWKVKPALATRIVRTFTKTRFSKAARHTRRIGQIKKIEKRYSK